jgi:hypothetical protein|uniref:NET domain-containing protein n=1 Tax=viral metagenome TaxID=1070528 RepID=A0A6C0K087_9ZZZZ
MSTLTNEEYERRRYFLDDLKILSKTEAFKIYEILKNNNVEYTENSNGIFFDLVKLSKETFDELNKYMEFCHAVRKEQSSRDNEERQAQDLLAQ